MFEEFSKYIYSMKTFIKYTRHKIAQFACDNYPDHINFLGGNCFKFLMPCNILQSERLLPSNEKCYACTTM